MSQLNDKLINYGNLAEFHNKLLNDLVTSDKSTWSSEKIQAMIADAGFDVEIVAELPATGDPHTIYFILKSDSSVGDVYDEWMYINNNWEMVGNTQIDLSDYAKISDVDASLALKTDKSYVDSSLALKQNLLSAGQNIVIDASNNISAEGYVFDATKGSFAELYFDDDNNVIATNTATGIGAHAEGYSNIASGDYGSHAEGYLTKATYTAATEGGYNHGVGAHAEGWSTEAKHDGAHAEGTLTLAAAQGAHAEGAGSQNELVQALGVASHAEGVKTIARNRGEHAEGFRNISHTTGSQIGDSSSDTMHSVGIGTNNLRRNAEEIMQNGDVYVFGIGNYDGIHIKNEQGAPAGLQTLQEVIANKADVYEVATTADIEALFIPVPIVPPNDEIWYTTSDGEIITPNSGGEGSGSGAGYDSGAGYGSGSGSGSGGGSSFPEILSNTYVDGKGVIKFAEDITEIPSEAFAWKETLTSMQISDSVTSINGSAFDGCENLTSPIYNAHIFAKMPTSYSGTYAIPNGIESVADYAFMDCSGLTSVTIPNSVTSIGDGAFQGCSGLPVTDNVRYADTCAVGMGTTGLTNYTVKSGTRFIHTLAFSGSYGGGNITSITLPDTIEQIGRSAFWGCSSLTSITIPNSVTSIGDGAFFGCTVLANISFTGTIAQWNSITKADGWNIQVPATVVHCSDGDVNI